MNRVATLAKLGACHDALCWMRDNRHLSDAALWLEVEEPWWLLFVVEHAGVVDMPSLNRAIAPLLATWRVARWVALDEFEAHDARWWADVYASEAIAARSAHDAAKARYAAALTLAGQKCCAMIRATVAMPTRHQLADALAARSEPEFVKF